MLRLKKTKNINNMLFFKSSLININIYFSDAKIIVPNSLSINILKNQLFLKKNLNILSLSNKNILFFKKKHTLYLIINKNQKTKKKLLQLYQTLIQLKIKGLIQGFKLTLHLNGIGFKSFLKDNTLRLKLGFSHNILIEIPSTIQVLNQGSKLIFYSYNFIFLTQFVHFIKMHKNVEPYKGKGLILNSEIIKKKEGKKSKK